MSTFQQMVFTKRHHGASHQGVIVRQRFYVVDGFAFTPGNRVTLRLLSETVLQILSEDLEWCTLTHSFPI